jgi:ketosteroid isomerase-like protein
MDHPATQNAVSRTVVEAFYAAYSDRNFGKLAGFLADDVEWTISGPVGVLPFCGTQRGKAAVLKWLDRQVPDVFRAFSFMPSSMLVDGDQVARLNRVCAKRRQDGLAISYRLAQFIRFRENKVIEYVSIIDNFDAVEQVLGHELNVHDDIKIDGDLITL